MNTDRISIESLVEEHNGHLVIFIPLDVGGDQLAFVTKGLSDREGGRLKIVLPGWLVKALALTAGRRVTVNNEGNKLNIVPV